MDRRGKNKRVVSTPSSRYSGERGGERGNRRVEMMMARVAERSLLCIESHSQSSAPSLRGQVQLIATRTLPLSPEYRGEGERRVSVYSVDGAPFALSPDVILNTVSSGRH